MTTTTDTTRRTRLGLRIGGLALCLALVATLAAAGVVGPSFSKAFSPDTIGPGSTAMLIFTIDNSDSGTPVDDMVFTDTLPAGMTLAAPAFVSNDCGGTVTAPDGGSTITFEEGMLGAFGTCTIVVNVTAGAIDNANTTYPNTSGDLTSDAGNSGSASASLMVVVSLPGFSKSFAPSPVEFGGRSTLTFTIDNTFNSAVSNLDFTDVLPPGMVVADPANKSTTCGTALIPPTLTAIPGSNTITLDADGTPAFPAVAAGATCTVVVEVIGGAVGLLGNVSDNLLADFVEAGKASAVLEVTGVEDLLEIQKEFTDDPVAPGGTVTLEFTVVNKSRDDSATDITFTDDLTATLAGLTATGLPLTEACDPDPNDMDPGTGTLSGTTMLTFAGGTLPPETSCTFSVELTVDAASSPGSYSNTAGPVSGTVGGSPETGNTASDLLFVVAFPVLTKEFTDDPVAAGGTVTLEFTITNPATAAMTDITFVDELTDNTGAPPGPVGNGFLPFPVSVGLPPSPDPPCGGGSSLALVSVGADRQGLQLLGGSLAANDSLPGGPDTCTFSVTVDIPEGFPGGTYVNTTEPISATVSAATISGPPASDSIVIAGAPQLTKEFTDDPVLPGGGPVTLVFTLTYEPELPADDATAIAFTDDLTALVPAVPGLVASSVDSNTCSGATVDITTDPTLIDFSGGTLTPGSSCAVSVTLTVPAGAPVGFHTNTTSDVTATVGGVAATNSGAEDDLLITPLAFTKEFLDGGEPVIPGDTVILRFTIQNLGTSAADDASAIVFFDNLADILPGTPDVSSLGPPTANTCGGSEGGTATFLLYTGGSLAFGSTCNIEYELLVPAAAADGDYVNTTSTLTTTIGGSSVSIPPAVDVLSISSELLGLTKEFTDDPVLPGDPVTLEFTLTNLSAAETITDIAFDDDLDAALSGLEATAALFNDCGGMAAGFPAGLFEYSGGTLTPGASCTIVLTLDVPAGPLAGSVFPNTTTTVTGKVGLLDVIGAAASDDLVVQLVTFSKAFTDDPTTATGTATLEFTIANLDSSAGVTELAFSDDLDAVISGLAATLPPTPDPPCGPASSLAGTSFLAFSGGSLAAAGSPGDSCTFSVTVTLPETATAGSFLNATSALFSSGLPVADPATDFLDVEPPPAFSKAFAPDEIGAGEVSTLTFTIDNTASSLAASGLDFTDVLPAGVVVATPSGATTDCTGGVLTAPEGSDTISYSGGSVAAGASCTVSVDVTSDSAGAYVNTSGDLTSSSGNSGEATATLTVVSADLELVKTDLFEPVMTARHQLYELTVTNLGPGTAENVVLTDPLPAETMLVVAEPTASCSGAAGIVTCAVGDLAPGASFKARVMVYVKPAETPVALENLATVTSDTVDPVPGNNDVMETSEVLLHTGLAALDDVDGSGFPEVAVPLPGSIEVLVKDVGSLLPLHQTQVFPAGWALTGFAEKAGVTGVRDGIAVMAVEMATGAAQVRLIAGLDGALVSTSVVPAGFLPVVLHVIPDDGSMRTLIVVGAVSMTTGRGAVFAFDAANGAMVAGFPLHPGAWPIDLSAIDGAPLVQLGIVWVSVTNGFNRIQIKELNAAHVMTKNVPTALVPTALETVPSCCSTPADELAILAWDHVADNVRVRTIDAGSGALVSDTLAAVMSSPTALRRVAQVGATSADELAALYRNVNDRAALRLRDVQDGSQLLNAGFGPVAGAVPLGLAVAPDSYDSVADELAVYWLDPVSGLSFVSLRDAGSGARLVEVPIP